MSIRVAYWHSDGLDIYRFTDKKPIKEASGSLDKLKPFRWVIGKKVLIISRELLLHTRKRFPPAPKEKLTKAIDLEIGELFPIFKPDFHCRVYESSTAYTTIDIWAWESEHYLKIKKIFPFNYIVPEDLAYFSDVPEVKIFQYRGMTNILAHYGQKFLGGASFPNAEIDEKEVEKFLYGLGQYGSEIKRIKIYGAAPFQLKNTRIPEITRVAQGDHPPCIDYLATLNLNEFKVKGDIYPSSKIDFLFRILIYLIIGYGTMLYFTISNYDQVIGEIREKINSIEKRLSHGEAGKTVTDYSEVVREVNEKLSKMQSPLRVMEMIASKLPPGSFVIRMILNENNLELTASSKDPIFVVKAIGSAEGVKAARLKGAPVKDTGTGSYNFNVAIELSR